MLASRSLHRAIRTSCSVVSKFRNSFLSFSINASHSINNNSISSFYYDYQLQQRLFSTHTSAQSTTTETSSSSSIHPPIRIAIIGSGPSAFYTTKYLLKELQNVTVDMYERLPTPFGLVRYGVAPDHPEVKHVINDFMTIQQDTRYRYFGNVSVGKDVTIEELKNHYSAVVLAYGASGDRELEIPGNSLQGVAAARSFVNWYNGHPDYAHLQFHLNETDTAVVIGQGNVAIDVARILVTPIDILAKTDIADHALEALQHSRIKHVYIVGRRGPAQAAFTIAELRELAKMKGVHTVVEKRDFDEGMNEASQAEEKASRPIKRKLDLLREIHHNSLMSPPTDPIALDKQFHIKFLSSPTEFLPRVDLPDRVGAVVLERTRLEGTADRQQAVGTGQFETISTGLVLKSIGYKSEALAGVPFDSRRHVIPSSSGRVVESDGSVHSGIYVTGWLKRGPSGIIGSNITDAKETVKSLVEDAKNGTIKPQLVRDMFNNISKEPCDPSFLSSHPFISLHDWNRLDAHEQQLGKEKGRPRQKLVHIQQMLDAAKRM